jgi:acetylornithine deacetylase/succinyl-diaminopimelate desuccinylase-like protein
VTLDPVETLEQLVAIPSVNPMGAAPDGPTLGEGRLTVYLDELFRRLGLAVERQTVMPGRENILARLDGGDSILLLDAHQDTVPTEGMMIEPFRPERREGRLYGRGACDTKGGMAAMLTAISRLVEQPPGDRPTIVAVCTVNEEHGFSGAAALAQLWSPGRSKLLPRRPDGAVVLEPTGLDVVVAHKGVTRWRCHTHGRAAHSSTPQLGDNAIYKMARVVAALEHYAQHVLSRAEMHPLCGGPTLSVGTIHGGIGANVVPDRCTVEIDLRVPVGQQPEAARRDVIDYLQHAGLDFPLDHEPPTMQGCPLSDRDNGPLAARLSAVVGQVAGACRQVGATYATDGGDFSAAGVPTVVFGPGAIAQAHTADEWIALDQLQQAADVLYRFCCQGSFGQADKTV